MLRGRTPDAIVRMKNCKKEDVFLKKEKISAFLNIKSEDIQTEIDNLGSEDTLHLIRYYFGIYVENTGEVNITEFKVRLEFPPENQIKLDSFTSAYKDGWPEDTYFPRISDRDSPPKQMRVNIYSKDTYYIKSYEFHLLPKNHLSEKSLTLNWTLYLSNTLPIHDKFDIFNELSPYSN
jgi:hypothetical protein